MVAASEIGQEADGFRAWLEDAALDFDLRVAIQGRDDHWYALLTQFDIASDGDTPGAAVEDALALLAVYLRTYYDDGASFSAALRPIPRGLLLRLEVKALGVKLLRRVLGRRLARSGVEYEMAPGTLPTLAAC